MTLTAAEKASQIEAMGRAVLYLLCAHGLALPNQSRLHLLRAELLPAARKLDLGHELAALIDEVAAAAPASCQELASAHLRLFPPIASQDAPGYETAYRGKDLFRQVELLADIAGFYQAHGLRSGGPEKERPDHIVAELEFCGVLARKELHALLHLGSDEVEVCRLTRTLFLRDHLGCWGPAFGRRVAAVAGHPFYRSLGSLTAAWVEADLAASEIVPAENAEEPLPQQPFDDGGCGPCPVGEGARA